VSLVGAALVPAAPVLIAEISGRLRPASAPREAARSVIEQLISCAPDVIVVVAEGDHTEVFDNSAAMHLHRLGGMHRDDYAPGARILPIPLAIGEALLRAAGWVGRTHYQLLDASTAAVEAANAGRELADVEPRVGLLLLGNGSACSTPKAPGSFHPQAQEFNTELVRVIEAGDLAAIREWTPGSFVDQLSDVRVPLQVMVGAVDGKSWPWSITFAEEFQGVFYLCAGTR